MGNFDQHVDRAFERELSLLPIRGLKWMEDECRWASRERTAHYGAPQPRLTPAELLAADTLQRWLVRNAIREIWEERRAAPATEAELLARGRTGELAIPQEHVESVRRLAEAITRGEVDALPARVRALSEPFAPEFNWAKPEGEHTFRCDGVGPLPAQHLMFLAGRALCKAGRLEDARAAFHWGTAAWLFWCASGASDDTIRVAPYRWRWRLPSVLHANGTMYINDVVPRVSRVDWKPYDHVIGCGTTIRHQTLDLLGVPRHKQLIVEIHRTQPYVPAGTFPRLEGEVAVVDDVHEGQTALTLARLYDADVIDVGEIACSSVVSRGQPVCVVLDENVRADVKRVRQ